MGKMITLTADDGFTLDAYRADPVGMPKAGLVVLQELFGINGHIRSIADRYAAEGYLVIAPALFDRVEKNVQLGYGNDDLAKAQDIRAKLPLDQTLADIAAAIAVASEGGKVGLVGYCWGGLLAFLSASRLSGVSAAVSYYGGRTAQNLEENPKAPMIMHFGAKDPMIPQTDVEKIRARYPEIPVYVYDAGHGFNCDARDTYDETSADAALSRTLAFLSDTIG